MDTERREETTDILADLAKGDREASHRLMPLVYEELRDLADRAFRHQPAGHTLQPTAIVHEAFIRMVDQTSPQYGSRTHFMAVAATAMRQILIDQARRRSAQKRGGGRQRVAMHEDAAVTVDGEVDLLDLDQALGRLAELDERAAKVVELRFFGGLSLEETATALDIARSTVAEDWRMARAWLACELGEDEASD